MKLAALSFRFKLSHTAFAALMALYFALVVNLPFYRDTVDIIARLNNVDPGFIISLPVFLFSAFNLLFNLVCWPRIAKPLFIVMLLISSAVSYSTFNYGTLYDKGMVENIVETDVAEAGAYISAYSVFWLMMMGVLPSLLVILIRLREKSGVLFFLGKKAASIVLSGLLIWGIAALYYQDYASFGRNNSYLRKIINPYAWINGSIQYFGERYFLKPLPYQKLGEDAVQSKRALVAAEKKPVLLVFVVGETARVQNYPYFGYGRPTTPFTDPLEMIRFTDVASCGTATAVSVRCMFSELSRQRFDLREIKSQDNVLDILKRAGVAILWEENNGGDKGVARHIDTILIDPWRKDEYCQKGSCYDSVLLEDFDKNVEGLSGNRIIFLHIMGSHGPTYYRRYPKSMEYFQPGCNRADIENCTEEEIVNSYDNTIRYTDFFISQVIEKLKGLESRFHTAMIYISDHGESLGEGGAYLHGFPYDMAPLTQKRVPFMVWMSPGFVEEKRVDVSCLDDKSGLQGIYSHDDIFHSLLGVMDVETAIYRPRSDVFSSCRSGFP
ncbi:phosphoethanolamine transferase [Endozoicomonas ascidiicola]|uniref:phosphoethanolamine transferase n=1 Tax=Endozoicomonas ascidiicola TaxID=1698521 RepID=UPI0008332AB0|nr:phosphoethanolamine--lipid A transferase [Endozoicomonas ascidiicola]